MAAQAIQLWPDRDVLGRCEASREGKYCNDKTKGPHQCVQSARYLIEGRRLCTKHAEVAALRILIEQSRAAMAEASP